MKKYNVPLQSLIDHIKTALDVDPWAKEMVEELLNEQPEIIRCKDCKNKECEGHGGNIVCDITGFSHPSEWFCADGKQENDA